MSHHGWGGNPPASEEEARQRIIAAALACVQRVGPAKTTLSDVASELGVTRQTVYRHYANLGGLLAAVAQAGLEDFVERMTTHLAAIDDPGEVAIESVVFAVQAIPREPYIGLLLQVGETDVFGRGATSSDAFALGAGILRRIPVDWSEIGIADDELEGLAEILMRFSISFLQHPVSPPRSERELSTVVRRWLGPALGLSAVGALPRG